MAGSIEGRTDCAHAAIHHIRGCDEVGARLRGEEGHLDECGNGAVIVDVRAGFVEDAVVAVRGVRVECYVGEDDDTWALGLHFANRTESEVVRIQRLSAFLRLTLRVDLREERDAMDAQELEFGALGRELRERDAADARKRCDGLGLLALSDEERLDQVAGFDHRLREHRTDAGRRTEATEADGLVQGVRHGKRGIALWLCKGNGEGIKGPT